MPHRASNLLRAIRHLCGLTQIELAKRAGYSHAWVSLVERSKLPPDSDGRRKLAAALEVPEKELFYED